ncbi:hypothetical protein LNO20_17165 [Klebsiella quasipneumoniae subsp. quasipneumoniae]|nr:hypothetical protein [Klebsiella quasipneumoniae subsp. quasipneumoniae]
MLDNDSEGVEAYNKIMKMKLPYNISCMCLPDLKEFESFPTCGPGGLSFSNINRTAAAIECYLDLTYSEYDSYTVRWTNYKKDTGMYQGALEFKEYYAKRYLDTPEAKLINSKYNTFKLEAVLNSIIDTCSKLSGAMRIEKIKTHYPNIWTEEKFNAIENLYGFNKLKKFYIKLPEYFRRHVGVTIPARIGLFWPCRSLWA